MSDWRRVFVIVAVLVGAAVLIASLAAEPREPRCVGMGGFKVDGKVLRETGPVDCEDVLP